MDERVWFDLEDPRCLQGMSADLHPPPSALTPRVHLGCRQTSL